MTIEAYMIGHGTYVPDNILTNSDLEKIVDTSDDWIVSRTGMQKRHIAAREESVSSMGVKAARKCLQSAELAPQEIDTIICATMTPDHIGCSSAVKMQDELGCVNASAFDISAACSGWVYALQVARALVRSAQAKQVLVVASEKLSSFVNYKDRTTCVLFGDGAASCLISNTALEGSWRLGESILGSDGSCFESLYIPAGGAQEPLHAENIAQNRHYIHMKGPDLFKQAVLRLTQVCSELLHKTSLSWDDVNWFVCHQANLRIIDAVAKRLDIPEDKQVVTVDKYGNTSASSIGLAFEDIFQRGRLENRDKAQRAILAAFGAGLTWGAMVLEKEEWSNN